MLEPKPADLLEGVIDALRESVLPALPPGAAQRQLRAALHALGRLQRSWDRIPDYRNADIEDMRATLESMSTEPLRDDLTHQELQQLLVEIDTVLRDRSDPQARALDELYERMNERQLKAWAASETDA